MTYVTRIVRSVAENPVTDPTIDRVLQSAQTEAEEKVRKAELDAATIRSNAETEAETILKRAKDRAELISLNAKKDLEEELADAKAQAMLDHRKTINEDLQNSEQLLCKLVIRCLNKIVGEFSSSEKVTAVVQSAVRNLQNKRNVTLVVSSQDKELVEKSLCSQTGELPSPISKIVTEQGLDAGSCYLDFGKSKLEIDLNSQLSNLYSVLNQKA